ncbi:hypothetical protein CCP3SC15_1370007 [Gammaproteobacteria bacterium]
MLGGTIVASSDYTYLTFGIGAPQAALGVGGVAAWIGGGGQDLVGGVIANFAMLSAAAKFGVIANISATMMDGVAMFKNDTGEIYYTVRFTLPINLGSKKVRALVDELYEIDDNIEQSISKGDNAAAEKYVKIKNGIIKSGQNLLSETLESKYPLPEDLLVLSMISYSGEDGVDLFKKAVNQLSNLKSNLDDSGFLDYIMAINFLLEGKNEIALQSLEASIKQNPYAIEPVMLYINILSNSLHDNEDKILNKIKFTEENYDENKYYSKYSLLSLYFRVGTIYYNENHNYRAREFYEKAYDKVGFINWLLGRDSIKNEIQLGIANTYYREGNTDDADKIYHGITKDLSGDTLKSIQEQYAGR